MGTMIPNQFVANFDSATYNITADGQTTPDGIWKCVYKSNGTIDTRIKNSTTKVLYMKPEYVVGQTRACLLRSTQCYSDIDVTLDMNTFTQNRGASGANWEVTWIIFSYFDDWHHYFFLIHKDGSLELGRKDYNTQIEQEIYLATTTANPALSPINTWRNIRIVKQGNHIQIYVDAVKKIDIVDDGTIGTDSNTGQHPAAPSGKMKHGYFALYNEDCESGYDTITLNQI